MDLLWSAVLQTTGTWTFSCGGVHYSGRSPERLKRALITARLDISVSSSFFMSSLDGACDTDPDAAVESLGQQRVGGRLVAESKKSCRTCRAARSTGPKSNAFVDSTHKDEGNMATLESHGHRVRGVTVQMDIEDRGFQSVLLGDLQRRLKACDGIRPPFAITTAPRADRQIALRCAAGFGADGVPYSLCGQMVRALDQDRNPSCALDRLDIRARRCVGDVSIGPRMMITR
jgi:hypothetical protein